MQPGRKIREDGPISATARKKGVRTGVAKACGSHYSLPGAPLRFQAIDSFSQYRGSQTSVGLGHVAIARDLI